MFVDYDWIYCMGVGNDRYSYGNRHDGVLFACFKVALG